MAKILSLVLIESNEEEANYVLALAPLLKRTQSGLPSLH